jgi:hypothetical protein
VFGASQAFKRFACFAQNYLHREPHLSHHRMVSKANRTKGAFVTEDAILTHIYPANINTQTSWNCTIFGWSAVRRDLEEYFG